MQLRTIPHFRTVPSDLILFDFTDSGGDCQESLYANASWLFPASSTKTRVIPMGALSGRQMEIAIWRKTNAKGDAHRTPFSLNWIDRRADSNSWNVEIARALEYLVVFCTVRGRGLASQCLSAQDQTLTVGEIKSSINRRSSLTLEDCSCVELTIGKLLPQVANYGDALHLDTPVQNQLIVGSTEERNQCAAIAMAAACEWQLQNGPNRVHGAIRVNFLESALRAQEILLAKAVLTISDQEEIALPDLLHSAIHDATDYGGGRDVRFFNWPFLHAVWK